MRKSSKKLIVMLLMICTVATFFAGCTRVTSDEVVATLDGEDIKMDVVNFYLRLQQASYESSYKAYGMGEDMWTKDMSGSGADFEITTKESLLSDIESMLILEKHMSDYDVSITDEEAAAIDAAADSFMAANDKDTIKLMTASKETVVRVLTLYTISNKMEKAMIVDTDREVSDEEAAQKTIKYLLFSTADTKDADGNAVVLTDDEKAEIKAKAQEVLDAAKVSTDLQTAATQVDDTLTVAKASYGTDDTAVADVLKTAGDALAEGEYADLVEADNGYYVVMLESEFDTEATAAKKEKIITEREQELYTKIYEAWQEESEFVINQKKVDKISFAKHSMTVHVPETESTDTTDTSAETDTLDTSSDSSTDETESLGETAAQDVTE